METISEQPTASETAPQSASLWEDLVEVYFAPHDLFARRRDGRYLAALVVLTLVSVFLAYGMTRALGPAFDAEFARGMRQAAEQGGPQPSPEQLAQMQRFGEYFAVGGSLIITPLMVFLTGVVAWLLGRAMGGSFAFAVAMTVATFSFYPTILRSLTAIPQGFLLQPESLAAVSIGAARFFDPDTTSPALMALLGRIDLFSIWGAVLLAIGLRVAGGLPAGKAYAAAAIIWLLALVPQVGPLLLRGG